MKEAVNVFKITRSFFDWSFENPDKVKPPHIAIFFFAIEQNNRFGWKKKFGFPTLYAMDATGIKSKNTYYKAFYDLVDWGFIEVVTKSKNQNTANIISIPAVSNFKSASASADNSALDSANIQHEYSGGNIDKQINQKTKNQKQERFRPPSVDEVYKYMIEKDLNETEAKKESQKFWNNYDSKDWCVGKNKMKKWKSAVSNWINRMEDFNKNRSSNNSNPNVNNGNAKSRNLSDKQIRSEAKNSSDYIWEEL